MTSPAVDRVPVLVVDDDPQLLRTLHDILELRGYRALTAGSGEGGLRIAEQAAADLAIALVDLRLPDMDGIELIGRLHALSELTEVVILTGHASLDSAVAALRNESFDYLVKPVDPSRLLHTVQKASERWQRRMMEQKLAETEERFRLLVENISDMIFVTDRDGTVRYASASVERVLDVEPEALAGEALLERVHPDDRVPLGDVLAELASEPGAVRSHEHRLRHRDGSWRPVESTLHSLLDRPGVGGIVIAARDVADRKRLEAQLLQAQKMESVGRLAGGVAHDFNNLLTVILGTTVVSLEQLPHGSSVREALEDTLRAAERAADLTRQLLAFSRRQILQPRLLDVNELVRNAEKLLHRVIGEHITLQTVLAPELWPVRADPAQLEQVLMNLVVNARDAMPLGGRLTIRTARVPSEPHRDGTFGSAPPGEHVLLEVGDTGEGIGPDVQDRIFEPFFTTKELGKGTGLGLATVLGIVEQSGGVVRMSSEVGIGTSFAIYLPRTLGTEEARTAAATRSEVPRGTESVLLVEDEAMVRGLIAAALVRRGYRVLDAPDGQAALDLLARAGALDLLLTDVVLPGMSGIELAERVQSLRPGVRVLYITGYAHEASSPHGTLQPGLTLLQKPFTPDEVVERVRRVLDAPPAGEAAAGA